ncbi:MAG: TetR family transcriptional regulator [Rhodospirillales bacterium]
MAAAKKTRSAKKSDKRSTRDRLIDAALELAAETPWQRLSLPEIASHAGVTTGDALMTLPGRMPVLKALMDRIDAEVMGGLADDPLDGTTRDQLFDLLMRRFDALAAHRAGMASITRALRSDPLSAACLGGRLLRSMTLCLQAAGVPAEGLKGAIKAKALAAIHLNTVRVWLRDDDPGLAQTMKTLDKGLMQAEKVMSRSGPASTVDEKTA